MDHIKQIICILRDFIRCPERRVMATTISKLKLDLDFDSTSINQIQLVLFGFQDSVSGFRLKIVSYSNAAVVNNLSVLLRHDIQLMKS